MKLLSWHKLLSALSILLLVLFVALLVNKQQLEQTIETRESVLDTRVPTPLLSIKSRIPNPRSLSALIVHGFQCNKSMMVQLAKYLALNGIDCYLIDLPGHGSSSAGTDIAASYEISRDALGRLIEVEKLNPDRIALVGHSFGAMIIARMGIGDTRLRSHVLIGPGLEPGLGPSLPHNALFIVGERDYPFVREANRLMMLAATGETVEQGGVVYGSTESGDARLLWVAPGLGHLSLIYNTHVYRKITEWVIESCGSQNSWTCQPTRASPLRTNIWTAIVAVALTSLVALWIVRVAFRERASPALFVSTDPAFDFLILVATWLFSLCMEQRVAPLRFLCLEEGEVIASALSLYGAFSVAGWFAFSRRFEWQLRKDALKAVWIAIALVVLYYIASAMFISPEFYQLTVNAGRAWRFGAIALLTFPLFLVAEAVLRGLQGRGRSRILRMSKAFAVGAVYFALISFSPVIQDARLVRFAPFMLAVALCLQAFSCIVYELARATLLTSLFQCLIIAWILSAGFALC